jgi:hypothetical protein
MRCRHKDTNNGSKWIQKKREPENTLQWAEFLRVALLEIVRIAEVIPMHLLIVLEYF